MEGAQDAGTTSGSVPSARASSSAHEDKVICRYCHRSEEEGAPLLRPCSCRGELASLCYECMREWVLQANRLFKPHPFSCEFCKSAFSGGSQALVDYVQAKLELERLTPLADQSADLRCKVAALQREVQNYEEVQGLKSSMIQIRLQQRQLLKLHGASPEQGTPPAPAELYRSAQQSVRSEVLQAAQMVVRVGQALVDDIQGLAEEGGGHAEQLGSSSNGASVALAPAAMATGSGQGTGGALAGRTASGIRVAEPGMREARHRNVKVHLIWATACMVGSVASFFLGWHLPRGGRQQRAADPVKTTSAAPSKGFRAGLNRRRA